MDTAEKERLIAKIGWRYISATINTKDGDIVTFQLRPPTSKEQAKSASIYSVEYQRGIITGLSNENDIINDMIALNNWSHKKDSEIEGLKVDIHNIKRGLLDFLFNRTKLENTRSLLRRAESALFERLFQKHELTQNSAEAHAIICQQRYLISCITEKESGDLFWPSEDSFENFDDIGIILQLCEIFFKQSHISTRFIRELARSQQWRVYWEIAKNTSDLFDGSVLLWSSNQRELVYWSTIYDSVYDAYERPSKDIIMDDDLLDSWFIRQSEKAEGKMQSDVPKSNKPGRNENFIMADREGAKRVYDMNDRTGRANIKARQKILNKLGTIKEQDMPDSKIEIRRQAREMQVKHVKDISRK